MRRFEGVVPAAVGLVCLLTLDVGTTLAQPAAPRVTLGAQVQVLTLENSDANVGLGGRVTVDVTPWLSVEGEYQFIPRDQLEVTDGAIGGQRLGIRYHRRRSTALAGIKAGYRGQRVGVFGKVRPGVTRLTDRGVECLGDVCIAALLAVPQYRNEFALDVGGVVEVYASPRWLARVDVGSLIVRHRSTAPPCPVGYCTSSNLAVSAGVGVRF
jgi:hypothetical protein